MMKKIQHRVICQAFAIALLLGMVEPQVAEAQSSAGDSIPQPRIALRTNLFYDATLSPNIGVDVRVDSTWTVGLLAGINAWDIDKEKNKKWRHLLFSLRARKYLNDTIYHKRYVEVDAISVVNMVIRGSWPVTGASRLRLVLLWAMLGSKSTTVRTAVPSSAMVTASSSCLS